MKTKIIQPGMGSQFMSLVTSHIFIAILGAMFSFSIFTWVFDKPIAEFIFSVVFTLIYFSVIYSRAWSIAGRDKKTYTETSVYMAKGAVLSIGVLILNLILWLCYKMAWQFMTIDGSLATWTGIFYNVLYVFNTFMYMGFINLHNGTMNWYGHIIIYLVPVAASTLGYIAGVADFTFADKLMPFMYEQKKK